MVPGRKNDVADAGWIAQLLEVGLLRASFVPPPVIRELRDLTRNRKRLTQDHTRESQRVEKVLEDAGIKLASVASQTLSKSGRAMIDALITGERDPVVLAELAKRRMRSKIPELQQALVGRFGDHHAAMLRLHLAHIDHLDRLIDELDAQIESKLAPFVDDVARLRTVPGIGPITAQVLIAEIGVDMSVFPTADHLASWCGVCPGNNQSAGKQKSGRTNMASPWLTDALIQAAWAAARSKDTWLSARFSPTGGIGRSTKGGRHRCTGGAAPTIPIGGGCTR
jgi:transposase